MAPRSMSFLSDLHGSLHALRTPPLTKAHVLQTFSVAINIFRGGIAAADPGFLEGGV